MTKKVKEVKTLPATITSVEDLVDAAIYFIHNEHEKKQNYDDDSSLSFGDPAGTSSYGHYNKNRYHWFNDDNENAKLDRTQEPFIFVEYEVSGYSGGGYQDDAKARPYTSDKPPKELALLDNILELICPEISFLKYKTLLSTVLKNDTRSENEYYGNSTNYAIKKVSLVKLFDELKSRNLVK